MKPGVRSKKRRAAGRRIGKLRGHRSLKNGHKLRDASRVRGTKRAIRRKGRTRRAAPRSPRYMRSQSSSIRPWMLELARSAGTRLSHEQPVPAGTRPTRWVQQLWAGFWDSPEASAIPRSAYREAAHAFIQGFRRSHPHVSNNALLLPTRCTVGVVVVAMNEEQKLPQVLKELGRLPLDETIIIVNGSHDRTLKAARMKEDAIVLHYRKPLGHDVGRAIGAKLSSSDIVLFLDGDFVVEAEQLAELVSVVDSGVDVALNNISPYLSSFRGRDNVSIVKEFLNRTLGRPDLGAASLTAVPYALSRRAIQSIGYRELMVPPKAQALAIKAGLRVEAPIRVDVVSRNKVRKTNVGALNPVERLIMGDHMEALRAVMAADGPRLDHSDTVRKRI